MIYAFFADGFEEIEAITPVDILKRAGFEVKTVGVTGDIVTGAHKIPIKTDISLSEVDEKKAELLFLPGGMPGTTNLKNSKMLENIILNADKNGIYIAAICAAPMILGELNLLNGKKATCFPGFEAHLLGSTVCPDSVVSDKNIITAKGAGAAHKLGFKLVSLLKDQDSADKLSEAMQY